MSPPSHHCLLESHRECQFFLCLGSGSLQNEQPGQAGPHGVLPDYDEDDIGIYKLGIEAHFITIAA